MRNTNSAIARLLLVVAASTVLMRCDSPAGPARALVPAFPARMLILSGEDQTGSVGAELSTPLTVRVVDASGAAIGGQIVNFRVIAGNGKVFAGAAVTDAQGRAAERWTLGTVAAESQRIEARAVNPATGDPLVFAVFNATARAGAVALLERAVLDSQVATAGTPTALPPAVRARDQYGNAVADVGVIFRAVSGAGVITDSSVRSDETGRASSSRWTLGTRSGVNTVIAAANGAIGTSFTAIGRAGAVARVAVAAGDNQSWTVDRNVDVLPAVQLRDALDNPVSGQSVAFTVSSGAGQVVGGVTVSDATGTASPTAWRLGVRTGANTLRATIAGQPPITFTATGTPDKPELYGFVQGSGQIEVAGSTLPSTPKVRVVDKFGNRIPGIAVSFGVERGAGSIASLGGVTDSQGDVTPGAWRLGAVEGFNVLGARSPGFPNIELLARAVPASAFPIDVRYLPGPEPSAAVKAVVGAAVARLRKIFVRAPTPLPVTMPANVCADGQPAMSETVPGLVVWVDIRSVDGIGGNLGSANWCSRRVPSLVTAIGYVRLDLDDLTSGLSDGSAYSTITHELLHVAGFPSLWTDLGLLRGNSSDPWFAGTRAVSAFRDQLKPSLTYSGLGVPVENTGGLGSALKHWRSSLFSTEMMSAFGCGGQAPLSYVTLAAFLDMGLHVTEYGDDDFEVPLAGCPRSAQLRGAFEEFRPDVRNFVDETTGVRVSESEAYRRASMFAQRNAASRRQATPAVQLFGRRRN